MYIYVCICMCVYTRRETQSKGKQALEMKGKVFAKSKVNR